VLFDERFYVGAFEQQIFAVQLDKWNFLSESPSTDARHTYTTERGNFIDFQKGLVRVNYNSGFLFWCAHKQISPFREFCL
jgi:hypothetical protein